jgi:cytochrome c peroxidase
MSRVSSLRNGPGQIRNVGFLATAVAVVLMFGSGCDGGSETEAEVVVVEEVPEAETVMEPATDAAAVALAERAAAIFGVLPSSVPNSDNVGSPAKIDLGRMLYYDARLSKNHDIACNSCHLLDAYGVDGEPTSPGHRGQRGGRNSPTVYNAAIHLAQFWDGREPDVEAQAGGPVLNPVEMAAPSEEYVVAVLASIPGYVDAFPAAFPDEENALTYANMARAIGAFERNLMTPGRFDAFMAGDLAALDATERRGLTTFMDVGCNSCHTGAALGGALYRKLGFIFPYATLDIGREDVTGEEVDRHVFKVPSLRNIVKTGPYLHDGSIDSLEEIVRIMGYHQVGVQLDDAQIADIIAFLGSLTGEPDVDYVAKPELPASGPDTPAPDPS